MPSSGDSLIAQTGSEVLLEAGLEIDLEPGFEVCMGSSFEARINPELQSHMDISDNKILQKEYEINLSGIVSDVYFLVVNGKYVKKIIKL